MMAELFWQLMRLAAWLAPEDPATTFMWLVIGGTVLVVATVLKVANIIDRTRNEVRVTTDAQADPANFGDMPHLPRGVSGRLLPTDPPHGGSGVSPPRHHIDIRVLR